MANNIFVKIPERGDACIGRLSDKKLFYIKADTLVTSELDKSVWEVQGVVSHREGKKVTIVGLKKVSGIDFCNRVWYYLSDYTLDGAEHTIVLAIPTKANWDENVVKTITYTAHTVEEFISALNAAFEADTDFEDQDWYADLTVDGRVRVHYVFSTWQNLNFLAESGITKTKSMPELIPNTIIRRKNGNTMPYGAVLAFYRSLDYFRGDNGNKPGQGGCTTEQTGVKQSFPINLPTWLGTSTNNPGDFCKALRDVYGEGEEGWLRFMRSVVPVINTDQGIMMYNCIERSELFSSFTYTSRKATEMKYMFPVIGWCVNFSTSCLPAGSWNMPSSKELTTLMRDITLGTGTTDLFNRTMLAAGGVGINNGSSLTISNFFEGHSSYILYGGSGILNIMSIFGNWTTNLLFSQQTLKFD